MLGEAISHLYDVFIVIVLICYQLAAAGQMNVGGDLKMTGVFPSAATCGSDGHMFSCLDTSSMPEDSK